MREVKHYLVIDLEATTSDDGSLPRDEMETIEIGAVLVRASTLTTEAEFQTFVRPVRHPTLTAFCTELTGISQEMLADAPAFPEAMESLRQAMLVGRWGVVWGSWGLFDDTQLRRDCAFHGVDYPMLEHMNLKNVFSAAQGRRKRYGMAKALRLVGLELEGAHHRALDDARNIARLLPWIVGGERLPNVASPRQRRAP
ncbi:MAG: exonuclease domain-containing protein [Deltaproteobacteria bacterium]|nr:MAG: exonuclease domain-containing protein [Deltaproteobacteria bacterium]